MGSSRSTHKNNDENIRALYRELLAENRRLRRELARCRKNEKQQEEALFNYADVLQNGEVAIEEDVRSDKCPDCGSPLKEIDCGIKLVYSCLNGECDHRHVGPLKK